MNAADLTITVKTAELVCACGKRTRIVTEVAGRKDNTDYQRAWNAGWRISDDNDEMLCPDCSAAKREAGNGI